MHSFSHRSLRRLRAGFTLSEMLAVIVIVAALAALLFPAFSTAKGKSKETVCLSNLHQTGIATSLYVADDDGNYPKVVNAFERQGDIGVRLGRGAKDDPKAYPTPRESLSRYLKDDSVFRCPMDLGSTLATTSFAPTFYEHNDRNSYLFAELFDGQTESSWHDPTQATWACDGSPSWHSPDYNDADLGTYRVISVFYDWHVALKHGATPTFLE